MKQKSDSHEKNRYLVLFLIILTIGLVLIFLGVNANRNNSTPNITNVNVNVNSETRSVNTENTNEDRAEIVTEDQKAQFALEAFFSALTDKKYTGALTLFAPNEWETMSSFVDEDERNDHIKVLQAYCERVQTCLPVKILSIARTANDSSFEYVAQVQFIAENGDPYVLGPCCGATEEEMPSQDIFEYHVKLMNGGYKVITPPVYNP